MSHSPPIPAANQSPFPLQATPPVVQADTVAPSVTGEAVQDKVAAVQDAVGPLIDKARTFARERPYATAALVGTVALALLNSLRGARPKA